MDTSQILDTAEERGDLDDARDKIALTAEVFEGMHLKTLREELKKRRHNTSGNESLLQGRLVAVVESNVLVGAIITFAPGTTSEDGGKTPTWLDPSVHWEELYHESACTSGPETHTFTVRRAPTAPEGDGKAPVKHNFAEKFDRPAWKGKKED